MTEPAASGVEQLTLHAGAWEAVLLPMQGAAFAALRHAGRDVLAPIPAGADPNRGPHGAFLMVPWTNRLDHGRLPVGHTLHSMPINRPAERTSIHGLARDHAFAVESAAPARAALTQRLDHAPFHLLTRLEAALDAQGLSLSLSVANLGDAPVPIGLGWHPFFRRPPGTRIRFAATHVFGRDTRNLPTTARPCAGLSGDEGTWLGLDAHFAGWDGVADLAAEGMVLRLSAQGAWSRNLHLYAPRGVEVLCLEPVSHVPDVVNRPDIAAHGAMSSLPPGAVRNASLTIHRH